MMQSMVIGSAFSSPGRLIWDSSRQFMTHSSRGSLSRGSCTLNRTMSLETVIASNVPKTWMGHLATYSVLDRAIVQPAAFIVSSTTLTCFPRQKVSRSRRCPRRVLLATRSAAHGRNLDGSPCLRGDASNNSDVMSTSLALGCRSGFVYSAIADDNSLYDQCNENWLQPRGDAGLAGVGGCRNAPCQNRNESGSSIARFVPWKRRNPTPPFIGIMTPMEN